MDTELGYLLGSLDAAFLKALTVPPKSCLLLPKYSLQVSHVDTQTSTSVRLTELQHFLRDSVVVFINKKPRASHCIQMSLSKGLF